MLVWRRALAPCGACLTSRLPQQAAVVWRARDLRGLARFSLTRTSRCRGEKRPLTTCGACDAGVPKWWLSNGMMLTKAGAHSLGQRPCRFGFAEQCNAVDAFGPEPVRVSDARVGLGATDCGRWAALQPTVVGGIIENELSSIDKEVTNDSWG